MAWLVMTVLLVGTVARNLVGANLPQIHHNTDNEGSYSPLSMFLPEHKR